MRLSVHHATRFEMQVDLFEQRPAQVVLFQQVAEFADRGFVRHRLAAQIDASEPTHRKRLVQRLLHPGVGQVKPLLQEIDPQHTLHTHRRAAVAGFGVDRGDQRTQILPWHNLLHLGQERRPPRRFAEPFEANTRQGHLPHHAASLVIHPDSK